MRGEGLRMLWDFPFPSLPRAVKESLFLEKKGGSVAAAAAAKEPVSCPCVCAPWTGQGHRHAPRIPCALTNSISPKPSAKVPAPLPLTLESGKKELLYPGAVKWIPESGFAFNHLCHCVLRPGALPPVPPSRRCTGLKQMAERFYRVGSGS